MRSPRDVIVVTVGVAMLLLPFASAIVVFRSLKIVADAEDTLGAYALVMDVLGDYLTQNGGKWPKSWEDLVVVRHSDYSKYRWPEDIAEIRERVRIDFSLKTSDVVLMDINYFTAVTQRTGDYGPYEWLIARLLYRAKRAVGVPGGHVRKGDAPDWFKDVDRVGSKR